MIFSSILLIFSTTIQYRQLERFLTEHSQGCSPDYDSEIASPLSRVPHACPRVPRPSRSPVFLFNDNMTFNNTNTKAHVKQIN